MRAADFDTQLACVNAAIASIKAAQERWLRAEQDASASQEQRDRARAFLRVQESMFSCQWENVVALLALLSQQSTALAGDPCDRIEIVRTEPNQFTVCSGDRHATQLTFDEALGAAACWILKPDKPLPFLRIREEHDAFDRSTRRLAGEQADGTFVVPAAEDARR
jgi:hypothetical protein